MDSSTKLALGAGLGIAAVAGLAYVMGGKTVAAGTVPQASSPSYTPSSGTHNLTVPVNTGVIVNTPAGASNLTVTAPGSAGTGQRVVSTSANTIFGTTAGTVPATVSISWTDSTGATQNDSVVVTVQ